MNCLSCEAIIKEGRQCLWCIKNNIPIPPPKPRKVVKPRIVPYKPRRKIFKDNPELLKQVISDYKKGMSKYALAKKYKCQWKSIVYQFEKHGII